MQTYQFSNRARYNAGFGLVEMMVALIISLILLAGVGQIFLSSKKSYQIQNSMARQQENGRFVIGSINQDLRRAGYWGGNADITQIIGSQSRLVDDFTCSSTDNTWGRKLDSRIYGLDDTNDSTNYACIPDSDYLRGDVVVVRYAAPWQAGTATSITTPTIENNNRLYIRSTLFESRMFKGSEENNTENTENISDVPAVRTAELIAHAYYIGPSSSPDCTKNLADADKPVPALFREALDDEGEPVKAEIAYGVDHLQLQYGVDTDADLSVDHYLNADEIVDFDSDGDIDWDQVIAVKVWLLARAECPETGYTNNQTYVMGDVSYTPSDYIPNDAFRRQLYTSTVKLRNR